MAFQNLTMNLDALQNITSFQPNLTDSNAFSSLVSGANSVTNNFLILAIMLIISIVTYITLTDKTPFGSFGYDDIRGVALSLCISSLFGWTLLSVGWTPNFYIVAMFSTLYLINFFIITIYSNPE